MLSSLQLPDSHTSRYDELTLGNLADIDHVVFAKDATEERANLAVWTKLEVHRPDNCISISQQDFEEIEISKNGVTTTISLRDQDALTEYIACERLMMDISGMPHHVWAPIFQCGLTQANDLKVVYAEPKEYKPHPSPSSPTQFDLSEGYRGLAPIPGFIRLNEPIDPSKSLFVALIGFEGNRPRSLALNLEPKAAKVIPVIGVPGFQVEYPAFTIACNRPFIDECEAHSNIHYARASCPFDAYKTLRSIREDNPDHYMFIAPVGTKPHALGAVWFAHDHPDDTELMYDHPFRKAGRTDGVGTIHVFHITADFHA